jgi:hypothetical protein
MDVSAIVDVKKNFIGLYVGILKSVNDSQMLERSHLYHRITQCSLLNMDHDTINNVPLYIIGNKGFSCLPSLLLQHKHDDRLIVL